MFVVLLLAACQRGPIPASYCASFAKNGKDTELPALFEEFARRHGLHVDRSNPAAFDYFDAANTYFVHISFDMGDAGTVVTLFAQKKDVGYQYAQELDAFVAKSLLGRYSVTPCSAIKGFSQPTLYGWPKR